MNPNSSHAKQVPERFNVGAIVKRLKAKWKQLRPSIRRFLKHPLYTAILGTIVGGLIVLAIQKSYEQPPSTTDIEKTIKNEAKFARGFYPDREKDIAEYLKLFADDALVIDFKTGEHWKGHDKIAERIRPLHFTALVHSSWTIKMWRDTASADTYTTFSQDKPTELNAVGKESWQFQKINGTWKVISFEYDLPQ